MQRKVYRTARKTRYDQWGRRKPFRLDCLCIKHNSHRKGACALTKTGVATTKIVLQKGVTTERDAMRWNAIPLLAQLEERFRK